MIDRPNWVWAADLTYIQMAHGFQYRTATIDVCSRKVLAWRVSNTMVVDFCVEALQKTMARYGQSEIFNTDQGSKFAGVTLPHFVDGISLEGSRPRSGSECGWRRRESCLIE